MNPRAPALICLLALAGPFLHAVEPAVHFRHSVVRVPEKDYLHLWMKPATEDELHAAVWQWVDDGKAQVLSDLEQVVETRQRCKMRQGRVIELPQEFDQDFEDLLVPPVTTHSNWVGMAWECETDSKILRTAGLVFRTDWKSNFQPGMPLVSRWPVTWSRNAKPRVGWMDQYDILEENITTSSTWNLSGRQILAVARPPNAVFPADGEPAPTGLLDVTLARVRPGPELATHTVEGAARPPAGTGNFGCFAIGIDSGEALRLLTDRNPAQDDELLEELMNRIQQDKATLHGVGSLAVVSGVRCSLTSARRHLYPTEMPSIPSAWGDREVGLSMELEPVMGDEGGAEIELDLQQHLTAPRRGVWSLALDAPEMVMWQPQFISLQIKNQTTVPANGVTLHAAVQVPDCLAGDDGLAGGRTILVFSRLRTVKPDVPPLEPGKAPFAPPDPFAPAGFVQAGPEGHTEITAWIIEVPADEEDRWRAKTVGLFQDDASAEIQRRLADHSATLRATMTVACQSDRNDASCRLTEDVLEVVEDDESYHDIPGRYRPTALEDHPTGISMEMGSKISRESDPPAITLTGKITYHDAMPKQPTLEETLAQLTKNPGNYNGLMKTFEEDWEGSVSLAPDQTRLVNIRRAAGPEGNKRLHLLFLHARLITTMP